MKFGEHVENISNQKGCLGFSIFLLLFKIKNFPFAKIATAKLKI